VNFARWGAEFQGTTPATLRQSSSVIVASLDDIFKQAPGSKGRSADDQTLPGMWKST
jgi:hypothetical protein